MHITGIKTAQKVSDMSIERKLSHIRKFLVNLAVQELSLFALERGLQALFDENADWADVSFEEVLLLRALVPTLFLGYSVKIDLCQTATDSICDSMLVWTGTAAEVECAGRPGRVLAQRAARAVSKEVLGALCDANAVASGVVWLVWECGAQVTHRHA